MASVDQGRRLSLPEAQTHTGQTLECPFNGTASDRRKTPAAEPPLAVRRCMGAGWKRQTGQSRHCSLAAEQSEALYQAIVEHRQEGKDARPLSHPLGFDPTRPTSADWQRILEKVGERYAELLARVPQPPILTDSKGRSKIVTPRP
ncbi:MAG: hypothetical protein U0Y68_15535 [Blastocatellia bacterium]